MQDLVSQARKNGMISTGIDLFLAAVPATLVALDIAKGDMLGLSGNKTATCIFSGIVFTIFCVSVFFRLRALRKISMLSGIKAAALYRNCIIVCICVIAITSIFIDSFIDLTQAFGNDIVHFGSVCRRNLHDRSVVLHKFCSSARKRRGDF